MVNRCVEAPPRVPATRSRTLRNKLAAVRLIIVINSRMKSHLGWIVVSSVCFAANAFAQSAIEGEVKGVDGSPLVAAGVRAERQDKKAPEVSAKTDAKGHFAIKGLAVGTYSVDVMAGGAAVSSTRVTTRTGKPMLVTFDMKQPRKAITSGGKKKKKFVWMPEETGSHIGGHYVEVDEDATVGPSGKNIQKGTGKSVQQFQQQNNIKSPSGGG